MSIERLEKVGDGPLRVVHSSGLRELLPEPAGLSVQQIGALYETNGTDFFAAGREGMTTRRAALVFHAWIAHHDMPSPNGWDRLTWMVDRYTNAVESDLQNKGLDLVAMWRARSYRKILIAIDALPLASKTQEALHTDPEYARAALKARRARQDAVGKEPEEEGGPPLSEWTQEVAISTKIYDAVVALQTTLVAVNSAKGRGPKAPKPAPRPWTAHKMAKDEDKKTAHDSLVARVLPTPPAQ